MGTFITIALQISQITSIHGSIGFPAGFPESFLAFCEPAVE